MTSRRPIRYAIAIALSALGALVVFASSSERAPVHSVPAKTRADVLVRPISQGAKPATKLTLADFSWLVGRWRGDWGPRIAEQAWMPARAGVMVGSFQLTGNRKTLVVELFTLVQTSDGIEYRIRHFTPSLAAWEQSGPATLKLTGSDPRSFVFENQAGGQPKRTVLSRLDADTFVLRSEIAPQKGPMHTVEITYHRQTDETGSRRTRSSHHKLF